MTTITKMHHRRRLFVCSLLLMTLSSVTSRIVMQDDLENIDYEALLLRVVNDANDDTNTHNNQRQSRRTGFLDLFGGGHDTSAAVSETVEGHASTTPLEIMGQSCTYDPSCGEVEGMQCSRGLPLLGKRCLPASDSCLVHLVNNFTQSFQFEEWKESIFNTANVSWSDVVTAGAAAGTLESFQATPQFQDLAYAINTNKLPGISGLQRSADGCMVGKVNNNPADDSKQACSNFYYGLHLELGLLVDWVVGIVSLNDEAYLRLSMGVGPQAGAQISFVFGWYFAEDNEFQGTSVAFDVDALFGAGVGASYYFDSNPNQFQGFEFTIGAGIGGGAGIGALFTAYLEDGDRPTQAFTPLPTRSPSASPSHVPTVTA